jgi:hypothetical protein
VDYSPLRLPWPENLAKKGLVMSASESFPGAGPPATGPLPEIVEVALLLPGWQVEGLEAEARHRGLTAGQLLRRLVHDFFNRADQSAGRGALCS